MNELKPCPFCGSKPNISKSGVFHSSNEFGVEYAISCPDCHICFKGFSKFTVDNVGRVKTNRDGYKTIVDKWNTRIGESSCLTVTAGEIKYECEVKNE